MLCQGDARLFVNLCISRVPGFSRLYAVGAPLLATLPFGNLNACHECGVPSFKDILRNAYATAVVFTDKDPVFVWSSMRTCIESVGGDYGPSSNTEYLQKRVNAIMVPICIAEFNPKGM